MAGSLAILIILQFFTYSSWAMMQKTSLDFSNAKMNENGGLCIMQEICIDDLESLAGALPQQVKMFLKPVWEGKMHGVTKIGVFRPLFCVRMLGKSTNYSTGTRPLCSTF